MARFSSGNSCVKDKPHSGWPCTAVKPRNEEHLDQLILANRQIATRELCTELNIDGGNGISQSLRQVGPTNAHTGT